MRATHYRDILHHEQVSTLAVGSGSLANADTPAYTNVAGLFTIFCFHGLYTVTMTSLPVGLSLAISSTSPPSIASPLIRYFHSAVTLSFSRPTISPVRIPSSTS